MFCIKVYIEVKIQGENGNKTSQEWWERKLETSGEERFYLQNRIFLTWISPLCSQISHTTLGWVCSQIWENFPKQKLFFRWLLFRNLFKNWTAFLRHRSVKHSGYQTHTYSFYKTDTCSFILHPDKNVVFFVNGGWLTIFGAYIHIRGWWQYCKWQRET